MATKHPSDEAAGMSNWDLFVARYTPVLLGVLIGTAGRYGLDLRDGRKFTLTLILADLLLLGIVALLARTAVDYFGLRDDTAVLCSALFAVGSDRVVRVARDSFLAKVREAAAKAAGNMTDERKAS